MEYSKGQRVSVNGKPATVTMVGGCCDYAVTLDGESYAGCADADELSPMTGIALAEALLKELAVNDLLVTGKSIPTIKAVRAATGVGLREAKDILGRAIQPPCPACKTKVGEVRVHVPRRPGQFYDVWDDTGGGYIPKSKVREMANVLLTHLDGVALNGADNQWWYIATLTKTFGISRDLAEEIVYERFPRACSQCGTEVGKTRQPDVPPF